MSLTNFNYNGKVIAQRQDGYLNGSHMTSANNKKLNDWARLKRTKAYTLELSEATGIPVGQLIDCKNGIDTWIHPSLAIELARWISPKFAVWCDAHIFNLMTSGQTSLEIDPIEEMRLKIELAKLENQTELAKQKSLELRHYVVTALPEPQQQRILGYTEVKTVEYRDRIIKDKEVIRDGTTLNKTQLCHRYGFLTKSGKPNFKQLNAKLDALNLPSNAWELKVALRENQEFKAEYLEELDDALMNDDRQMFLGE